MCKFYSFWNFDYDKYASIDGHGNASGSMDIHEVKMQVSNPVKIPKFGNSFTKWFQEYYSHVFF